MVEVDLMDRPGQLARPEYKVQQVQPEPLEVKEVRVLREVPEPRDLPVVLVQVVQQVQPERREYKA